MVNAHTITHKKEIIISVSNSLKSQRKTKKKEKQTSCIKSHFDVPMMRDAPKTKRSTDLRVSAAIVAHFTSPSCS